MSPLRGAPPAVALAAAIVATSSPLGPHVQLTDEDPGIVVASQVLKGNCP
jgi:hypothetical protein